MGCFSVGNLPGLYVLERHLVVVTWQRPARAEWSRAVSAVRPTPPCVLQRHRRMFCPTQECTCVVDASGVFGSQGEEGGASR